MTSAGAAQPIVISTAAPSAGPAIPIVVVSDGQPTLGGPCQAVVQVSDGRPVLAGAPLPVVVATGQRANNVLNGPPLPVYVVSGSLSGSTLWNGLIAYYKLDEASGVALDSGPNGLTLTDNNTVTSAAGQVGGARLFTAAFSESLSRADTPVLNPTTAASWAFWLKPTTVSGLQAIAAKWNYTANGAWSIRQESSGAVRMFVAPTLADNGSIHGTTPTAQVTAGAWAHVVVLFEGAGVDNAARLRIYVNGVQKTLTFVGTIPSALLVSSYEFALGKWGGIPTQHLNGALDEFKFWGRAITPAEIAEDYANGLAGRSL